MTTVAGLATRERLLAAARELIEGGGYGSASVAAIAERAGVASGTVYRHFTSKAELFLEVFRAVCAGEERAMRAAAVDAGPGAVDRLEAVLATFARRALQNRRLAWALLAEPVDPLVDAERLAYRERYASLVAAELRAAIAGGEIPDQDVDVHRCRARRRVRRGARRAAVVGGRVRTVVASIQTSCAGRSGRR